MVPPPRADMIASRRTSFFSFVLAVLACDAAAAQEPSAPSGDATGPAAQPAPPPTQPPSKGPILSPSAPQADHGVTGQEEEEKGPEARVPWKGTALKWSQSVTTTVLGVGSDYQSSSYQVYTHGYWVLLNYYLLDQETAKVRVTTSPGFDVEYTNSETTTKEREPLFRDLNLSAIGEFPYFLDVKQKYALIPYVYATTLFPTSKASQDTGTVLVTSPRALLVLDGELLPQIDFPQEFAVAASARWDHRFTQATEPVNPRLIDRPRQTSTGELYFTDQLSGTPFAHDTIEVGGFLYFAGLFLDQPLELQIAASWATQYLYRLDESACVNIVGTTCSQVLAGDAPSTRVMTSFSAGVTYFPMPEWGFSLGYANEANQLSPSGRRRSIFYSPDAMFTTELVISIDAIYEGLTGPRRGVRFYLPG